MNNLNNSADEVVECPLCMEPLEVDDLNFFPCTCGYQICRFCWHRIRTDENELCPACRKEYPENPADFKPLTQEEMIAFKSQKRQRDQQRKQKITENRKHLANVRVVQKNLVFVVGLPPRLADADILKKHEYFGKYGKIHKVVINPSTAYAGVQGPSASAYVTYVHNTDALRAIQSVNNIMIDGRLIKTSLGTTKYCSHFMKNQQCPKADCMYLHELGDPEASFTKEEMHQGKHQEYEKRLHDILIASTGTSSSGCSVSVGSTSSLNNKNTDSCKINNTNSLQSHTSSVSSNANTSSVSSAIQKEAWPSLSISPVSQKESLPINNNKNRKERTKQEKSKSEKNTKSKNNKNNNNICPNSTSKDVDVSVTISNSTLESSITNNSSTKSSKFKEEKNKDKNSSSLENCSNSKNVSTIVEDVIKDFDKKTTNTFPSTVNNNENYFCNKNGNVNTVKKVVDNQRSLSSSSNRSSSCVINISENNSTINGSVSGKSSPGSFNENNFNDEHTTKVLIKYDQSLTPSSVVVTNSECNNKNNLSENRSDIYGYVENLITDGKNNDQETSDNHINKMNFNGSLLKKNEKQDSVADAVSKLNLLDENSFFTSTKGIVHQSPMSLKTKNNDQIIPNQHNTGTVPNLPDLINGIDGYQITANEFHNSSNNYLAGSDLNRQSSYLQFQQQSRESSNDNLLQNSLFGTNMSKFFDFHKHQQQKLQQHCLQISGSNNINSGVNENLLMMPLMENSHLNSQLVEPNCILTSQNHQKQKLFGKIDQMLCHQPHPNQQIGPLSTQQNQYMHSAIGDDELGFDPFIETQKALAELIENEEEQQNSGTSNLVAHKTGSINHQHHQQHISEYVQRARMPPPGFNHVTNFNGYGVVPRIQNSKVMPFMNISNNYPVPTGQHIQHQQQLQIPSNAWGTHLGNFQQQINEQQIRQVNSNQLQNTTNQKGYTGNDWTAMDPAILSFRQFSFPHQTQITPQIQPQQQEIFLQQLAQQQTGFNSQSQHINGGNVGVPNTIMNTQQNSQPHVNANVQGMLEYLKTRQFV